MQAENSQRESMEFDVVIVGAGPAGLAAAIRLAQLSQQQQRNLSICILEKGASVGAHLLSGAVFEPAALTELIADWQQRGAPLQVPVTEDHFWLLGRQRHYHLPLAKTLKNDGNYIISLDQLCIWLAKQAEALGVNIFPGFPAAAVLFNDDKTRICGVQTQDMGLDKQGKPTERYQPGINIMAKQVILAEGCRGSLSEQVMSHFNLRRDCDQQTYGIGLKEIWKIDANKHHQGKVLHTIGWPLDTKTYGGSFIYHFEDNKIAIGFVIGLDYRNPYLDPFKEFQRFKTHPSIRPLLEGGECLCYGARALNEGGYQCIPKLSFPGGMLIGDSAGMLNIAKIKGNHNAIRSGMIAAEALLQQETLEQQATAYQQAMQQSVVFKELKQVRNCRPAFRLGLYWGLCYSAIDQYLLAGRAPWTLHFHQADYQTLKPAKDCRKIEYPKPDKIVSFDRMQQLYLSSTQHEENQPCHLKLEDFSKPIQYNLTCYDFPEQRYCPAGVYELVTNNQQTQLQINAANCLHCKTCDIKDPSQNIRWETPEGSGGPRYSDM